MAALDLTSRRFGNLEVLRRADNTKDGHSQWECKCNCGTIKPVVGSDLTLGRIRSCGKCGAGRLTIEEKKDCDRLTATVEAARKVLDDPTSTYDALQKAERTVRLFPKHRKALEDKVAARKQVVLVEKNQEQGADTLERIRVQYPETAEIPNGEDRTTLLKNLNDLLPDLLGSALASARFYVLGRIAEIESILQKEKQEIANQQAEQEERQAVIDQFACINATARIMEKVSPVLRIHNLPLDKREALLNYCKTMRTNSRKYAKSAEGVDGSGACKNIVALHIADVYEELVDKLQVYSFNPHTEGTSTSRLTPEWADNMLASDNFVWRTLEERCHIAFVARLVYKNNGLAEKLAQVPNYREPIWDPEPPHQSLEGVIANASLPIESSWYREEEAEKQQADLEKLRLTDPKKYKQLMKSGPDKLSDWQELNSEERARIRKRNPARYRSFEQIVHLLKPISTEVPTIIYRVPVSTLEQPHLPDVLYWPDGRLVKLGIEVIRDPKLGFVLAPEPACADPDFGGGSRKMEAYQDEMDGGKWKKRSVDEGSRWEQDSMTGHWRQTGGSASNRWAKPVRITFKTGDRHVPGSGRDHFREGSWWATEDIERVEGASWVKEPPKILPDIKLGIADSIALPSRESEERWEQWRTRNWGNG